jgi:osmoprotectant transport system ATP-binding protein
VPDDAMIRLEAVTKIFPGSGRPAVGDLTLEIGRGEFVTLVGPSGCGKTTTLKMINRIIEPTSGRIVVDGRDALSIPPSDLRRSIGYVIQQVGLFPHRTIGQNIGTVPALLGWDQSRIADRVGDLVELVGLDPESLSRYPSELSGGQQQRVGVARALAADPPVLLMDEPFGAVDPIVRKRLQHEFLDLQSRLGKTVVFVTHDIDEAILLGSRIAILNIGGHLEQYDTPEAILANPANRFVEDFLGGERGLKRLALLPVEEAALQHGPFVDVSSGIEEARRAMVESDVDWVGLLDGGRLLGWVEASHLDGRPLRDLEPKPFLVELNSGSSLREALDAVVTGHARVAVVVDDGMFRGMLDLEAIAEEITE